MQETPNMLLLWRFLRNDMYWKKPKCFWNYSKEITMETGWRRPVSSKVRSNHCKDKCFLSFGSFFTHSRIDNKILLHIGWIVTQCGFKVAPCNISPKNLLFLTEKKHQNAKTNTSLYKVRVLSKSIVWLVIANMFYGLICFKVVVFCEFWVTTSTNKLRRVPLSNSLWCNFALADLHVLFL